MSLPIAVPPSSAGGIASPPRATGGSAEGFAAAIREAEAPGDLGTRGSTSQRSVTQRSDSSTTPADDQAGASQLAIAALLGSTGTIAASVPGNIEPETSPDQPPTVGATTVDGAEALERNPASATSAVPTQAGVDAVTAAAGSDRRPRADSAPGTTGPAPVAGPAAQVAPDAQGEANADAGATRRGQGQMPIAAQTSAAGVGTPAHTSAGQSSAGDERAGQARAEALMASQAQASTSSASDPAASPSGAHALSSAQLADPQRAARAGQSGAGLHGATGVQSAESAAISSAATVASAPLAATSAAEATSAAGSARPALLPQLTGPVIALARSPEGQHSITLTVSPENLGPVTVRAHIVGSSIRLELHSPSDAGRDALRVILTDLRRDLSVAAPGASVDVSSRDSASGSSPDAQARPDSGRSGAESRGDAQARGDQQRPAAGSADTRNAPAAASVGETRPLAATDPSSAHSRIDVYA